MPPDGVAETVESRLDAERVRRCLDSLTELQRQSITLAYYGGYTYPEVASLLSTALGTIKTRVRDGLIRMRDCMGVSWWSSAGRVRSGRHDLHGLSGMYALDALTGLELDQFEHHLRRCPPCQNEVRGFRETATRLAQAVAASPPLALRERVSPRPR